METDKYFKLICYFLLAASTLGLFHVVNQYLGIPDDNPVEIAIEKVIKQETGLEIDLTPPEQKEPIK